MADSCCVHSSGDTGALPGPMWTRKRRLAMLSCSFWRRAARRTRWPLTRVPLVLPRSRTRSTPSVLTRTQGCLETLLWSSRRAQSSDRPDLREPEAGAGQQPVRLAARKEVHRPAGLAVVVVHVPVAGVGRAAQHPPDVARGPAAAGAGPEGVPAVVDVQDEHAARPQH